MGMCKPSGGINEPIYIKVRQNIPGSFGPPNTRTDMYDIDNPDKLLQQRWYDPDGKAIWDRDWKHKNENPKNPHKYPHDHCWDWNSKNLNIKIQMAKIQTIHIVKRSKNDK